MSKQATITAAGVVWFGTLLLACQAAPTDITVPTDSDAAVGTITHVALRDDGYVQLVLENCELEPAVPQYQPDTLRVLVTDRTPLLKEDPEGSQTSATAEDLTVGSRIRAYYGGLMWRSDPPGFVATAVVILRAT